MTRQGRPQGSFYATRGEGYGDRYMLGPELERDPRKQKIDQRQQNLVSQFIAGLPERAVVVDVPCGNGRLTQLTQQRDDLMVIPMDYNDLMLRTIPKRCPNAEFLGHRIRADVLTLPLPSRSVDLFLNFRLMHHIRDPDLQLAMYREIARVTRGRVLTTFWTTHCWRYLRKRILRKRIRGNPISPATFRAVCEDVGLVVERLVPSGRWIEEEVMAICRVEN